MPRLAIIFFLLSLPLSLDAISQKITRTQLLMGNVSVSITIDTSAQKRIKAFKAMEKAFQEAKRIENTASEWQPNSQTSLLNKNAGKNWVPIGKDLTDILSFARKISEETDGAFDITFASHKKRANFKDVLVLPELHLAHLNKGVKISVSGIAKGYIVDTMSRLLIKEGFRHFLVDAGDIFAQGKWTVSLRDPKNPRGAPLESLSINNQAISTSGNYERGNHLIDPKLKKPATNLLSATVIAPTSILADTLAKAVFILAARHQEKLIWELSEKIPHISIVWIDSQSELHSTENPRQ